jgi:uncharacterized phage protein gp47/JayE
MPIIYPDSIKDIVNKTETDFKAIVPEAAPTIRESWIGADIISFSARLYDYYSNLQISQSYLFPNTAKGSFLYIWGSYNGMQPYSATEASGNFVVNAINGTPIPSGTIVQSLANLQYYSTANVYAYNQTINIISLTRTGSIAYAVTSSPHLLASNISVTISGADQADYNKTTIISVTGSNTFTYQVAGSPVTPATGTIICTSTIAIVPIEASDFGSDYNQSSGAQISFLNQISGVSNIGYVDYAGIEGGQDNESDASFSTRLNYVNANPVSQYNISQVTIAAMSIFGVDRVWVQPITPVVGQATVYFTMIDNGETVIPDISQVAQVKDAILPLQPIESDENDLFVYAPTPIYVDFIFTALNPNTSTMFNAIVANLKQLFLETPQIGENLTEDIYRATIQQTIDPSNGQIVKSFTLSSPVGDIVIGIGELALLGTVTQP